MVYYDFNEIMAEMEKSNNTETFHSGGDNRSLYGTDGFKKIIKTYEVARLFNEEIYEKEYADRQLMVNALESLKMYIGPEHREVYHSLTDMMRMQIALEKYHTEAMRRQSEKGEDYFLLMLEFVGKHTSGDIKRIVDLLTGFLNVQRILNKQFP